MATLSARGATVLISTERGAGTWVLRSDGAVLFKAPGQRGYVIRATGWTLDRFNAWLSR